MASRDYHVPRMKTWLVDSQVEVNLADLTTDVDFAEVRFDPGAPVLWLPREVTVNIAAEGQQFRNYHRNSDCQRFAVATKLLPAD